MTAVVLAVTMAALLTSCFPVVAGPSSAPSESAAGPELSREAAEELLNAVPGLRYASVSAQISGLSTEAVIEVTAGDEASILAEGVLDYVLRVGWATELDKEPSQISLSVVNNGALLDLQDEANAIAGVDQTASPRLHSVHLNPVDYLGSWPGAVPTPPAG
ncbi:hypothetical protein [Cryobacterium sp. AP23]